MGRQVYLSDEEVKVLKEALSKWQIWAWERMEDWETKSTNKLIYKLREKR